MQNMLVGYQVIGWLVVMKLWAISALCFPNCLFDRYIIFKNEKNHHARKNHPLQLPSAVGDCGSSKTGISKEIGGRLASGHGRFQNPRIHICFAGWYKSRLTAQAGGPWIPAHLSLACN